MKGRTTLSIAHRLSTIQGADEILVLQEVQLRAEWQNHLSKARGSTLPYTKRKIMRKAIANRLIPEVKSV